MKGVSTILLAAPALYDLVTLFGACLILGRGVLEFSCLGWDRVGFARPLIACVFAPFVCKSFHSFHSLRA